MSKYKAIRTEINGIKFASKKEAHRYQELKLMERAKVITDLKLQVPFILVDKNENGRAIKYVADFTYYENGQYVVEDTKGYITDVFKIKKRLLKERYDIDIKLV